MPLRARALAALLVALPVAALLAACAGDKKTPEEQVRATLDEGVAALEDNDLAKAGDLLDESYRDRAGRDRRAMKAIAFYLLRQGPVRFNLSGVETQLAPDGESATVRAKVVAVQGNARIESARDLAPRGARSVDVVVKLIRDGDEWRVTSIDGDGIAKPDF